MTAQKRRPPNNPKLGEDRVCRCGKAYYVSRAELNRRAGTSCSNACAMALKKREGRPGLDHPEKFNRTSITPKAVDMLPLDDKGGAVRCAGPGKEHYRERGKMCASCEWRSEFFTGEVAS